MDDMIKIVAAYTEDDGEGEYVEKGIRGSFLKKENLSTRHTGELISSTPELIEKLKKFCEMMNEGLEDLSSDSGSGYYLDEIDTKVELTMKGELRLLASAGFESTGAITLKFKPRKKS